MEKLSAVIITLNEERNIERCILSLQNIADEIVVVDSFSTDKTEEICKRYPVTFFQQKWLGYSQQKNYANSLASNNLILSIDADEALSEELKKSILALKSNQGDTPKAYSMNRLTNYCGSWIRHCGWYPDAKVRIFDRRFVSWKDVKVHETLTIAEGTETVHLKGDLEHYSFYSISEHIATVNKYSTLAAEEAFEKRKRKSIMATMASAYWRFNKDYFIKQGFRDGFYGFVICNINAFSRFLRYMKLKELQRKNK